MNYLSLRSSILAGVMALVITSLFLHPASADEDSDAIERAEEYLLSQIKDEGQEYRFDLYPKEDGKFIMVLRGKSDGKTYATTDAVSFDNDATVIHAEPVDAGYSDNMESCGVKCKVKLRELLRNVTVKIDSGDLKFWDTHSFKVVRKKYERQTETVLGNQEKYSNPHMLKNTETGALFIPDENGCYRNLDPETGKATGEMIGPFSC
ncbi:MAG: hypothetical protein J6I35_09250 [Ruminobacter sp.]|uniref:hypothetical protein n=1 Tax=Ruminobacter sp. TaxID=2774296 RepID=UPI001B709FCA|nr:hypothetical protein [Ruminobacter sp.]MBP3749707.1 hypothetical protein [Ruminobacter sp.]